MKLDGAGSIVVSMRPELVSASEAKSVAGQPGGGGGTTMRGTWPWISTERQYGAELQQLLHARACGPRRRIWVSFE